MINKGQLLHEFNLGNAAMHAQHQQEMLKMQQSGMLTPTGMKPGMDHASMNPASMGHSGKDGMMGHDDANSVLVEPGKSCRADLGFWQGHPAGICLQRPRSLPGRDEGRPDSQSVSTQRLRQRLIESADSSVRFPSCIPQPNILLLGKSSEYIATYTPSLLFPIPRTAKWAELGLTAETLPYKGVDFWNCFRAVLAVAVRQAGGGHR